MFMVYVGVNLLTFSKFVTETVTELLLLLDNCNCNSVTLKK